LPPFFYYQILGNPVYRYLIFFAVLIAGCVLVRVLGGVLLKQLDRLTQRTKSRVSDLLRGSIRRYLLPVAYFTVFYLSIRVLDIGVRLAEIINTAILAFFVILGAMFASSVIVMLFNRYWETKRPDANRELVIRIISGLLKVLIWGTALALFLENIGVAINTLIAGVGVGGIAVAFAAQAILGDIFCFFSIFFDRPFEIGDFIVAGSHSGTVEHIGLKTTRLRTLDGEQLIFSNTDLTTSRIQNYKRMEQRRVLFKLGVTYDTPADTLREIPDMIRQIIVSMPDTSFSRSHFAAFGDYSLIFETAYFILSSDFGKYMDIHQQVNLAIKKAFEDKGIKFALPTTTVQLHENRD
jgi:small-conductance mechanosensitive channel